MENEKINLLRSSIIKNGNDPIHISMLNKAIRDYDMGMTSFEEFSRVIGSLEKGYPIKPDPCNCIDGVREFAYKHDQPLLYFFTGQVSEVLQFKLIKFCPFCGQKYE